MRCEGLPPKKNGYLPLFGKDMQSASGQRERDTSACRLVGRSPSPGSNLITKVQVAARRQAPSRTRRRLSCCYSRTLLVGLVIRSVPSDQSRLYASFGEPSVFSCRK